MDHSRGSSKSIVQTFVSWYFFSLAGITRYKLGSPIRIVVFVAFSECGNKKKSPTNALVKIVHFRGSDKILQRSQQFLRIPLFSRAITESLDICLLWSTMDQKLLIYRWIWCQNIIRRNEIWLEARML